MRSVDAFALAMFMLPVPDMQTEGFILERLLDRATGGTVRKRRDGERDIVVVSLRFEPSKPHEGMVVPGSPRLEIHFAPAMNYLATRWESSVDLKSGHTLRIEHRTLDIREHAPGVFFPARVESDSWTDGDRTISTVVEFHDLRLNRPISADVFKIKYLHGTPFTDSIRRLWYKVDEDGKAITPAKPLAPPAPPSPQRAKEVLGPLESAPEPAAVARTATQEAPPESGWMIWCSIGILLSALALKLIQARREALAAKARR